MLVNIFYIAGQEHLTDVCEYALHNQSPTIVVRRVRSQAKILNDPDNQWFLCCSANVLFLNSPLLLWDYASPNKSVCRIFGYEVYNSPITLWNGENVLRITQQIINNQQIDWSNKTVNIPIDWACSSTCPSPKAIIFEENMDYAELWHNYEEESANES